MEDQYRLFKVLIQPRRFYDCRYYHECLDHAARTLEPSLTCKGYERYQMIEMIDTPADIDGIVKLWRAVFWNWRNNSEN